MPSPTHPTPIESPSGLRALVNANGSIRRLEYRDIVLNLFPGSEMEGGPANIYLRHHEGAIASIPLLGPRSPARFGLDERGSSARGEWRAVRFTASLLLARSAPAWFWQVALENTGDVPVTVDLIYAQDVALTGYGAVRLNEYYVSQYLDHTPLEHRDRGVALAVRQNLPVDGRHPWAVIGSLGRGVSYATDALQFHGLATRAGQAPVGVTSPRLAGRRRQHEHSMAVVQDAPVTIAPGALVHLGFFGLVEADHPAATSDADLVFVDRAMALPEAAPAAPSSIRPLDAPPAATLFTARPLVETLELTEPEIAGLFGDDVKLAEREDGRLLSFFAGESRHVVLKAKELTVLRPHGHIVRTGDALTPDEASLTSTMWMSGVFNSMLTQGHVSINRFLSTSRSYLGLFRAPGQRIFVEREHGYALLDVPSAFEMTPNGGRWIYKHPGGLIAIRSAAAADRHELHVSIDVLAGAPCRLLLSHHIALNGDDGADAVRVRFEREGSGVVVRAVADSDVGRRFPTGSFRIDPGQGTVIERVGGDELLFADGVSRGQPYLALVTGPAPAASFRITGNLIPVEEPHRQTGDLASDGDVESRSDQFWRDMTGRLVLRPPAGPVSDDVACLQAMLPWFAHNAADPLPRPSRPRAVLRRRVGHPGRDAGLGRSAAVLGAVGAAARSAHPRVPRPESVRRLAAVVHVLRPRSAASGPGIPTATSCSGRCWRWRNTFWLPTTPRSSTRSSRSSIRRGTSARSAARSGRTSSARSASSPPE